jgi:hypothetical protein
MGPLVEKCCPLWNGPMTEIKRFGEDLIRCIECNRCTWPDSEESVLMELCEDDVHLVKVTVAQR